MQVFITSESRFFCGAGGEPVCVDGTYGYAFWRRYLDVFDDVVVLARCNPRQVDGGHAVGGPGVTVCPLPDSRGAGGALRRWRCWQREVRRRVSHDGAWILRMPGQIGTLLGQELRGAGIPYAVEAIGDPATVFAPGSYRHPLRPWLRHYFENAMRSACQHAMAVSYVTRSYLQVRYPASPWAFTTDYSSVEMPPDAYLREPRVAARSTTTPRIVSVGTMSQRYKGQQDLLEALAITRRRGLPWRLSLVGDGRYRSELTRQAQRLGLDDCVQFCGQLPAGESVRQVLDQADLFVLVSRGAEGLPRAIIEAQARGLPCLGTPIGGIPELLEPTELVPPANPPALASAIERLLGDPARLAALSRANLERARSFSSASLRERRRRFYEVVQEGTQCHRSVRRRRSA